MDKRIFHEKPDFGMDGWMDGGIQYMVLMVSPYLQGPQGGEGHEHNGVGACMKTRHAWP